MLETDLRDMRGQMETDLRSLKMQITQLGNNASSGETATTAELRDLRDQVERLADAVSMASRRMERTRWKSIRTWNSASCGWKNACRR